VSPRAWPTELVPGVDSSRLLRALCLVETDGGRNNCANHEPAYMPAGERFTIEGRIVTGTGKYFNELARSRWQKFGLPTSASWGPWQILYHTAANLGFTGLPWDLYAFGTSEPYVKAQLLKIAANGAASIGDFADAWNSGTFRDDNRVPDYRAKVEKAYERLGGSGSSPDEFQKQLDDFLRGKP
jgi:hypothetical protein